MNRSDGTPTRVTIQAPAKINLTLRVLGRREDGFHTIESVFAAVDLCDTLTITPRSDDEFRLEIVGGSSDIGVADNLVVKAAQTLRDAATRDAIGHSQPLGADFVLTKRIPSQAGLGGGSSDAVAALVGLNVLWQAECSDERLHQIAALLGSDLNFFLTRTLFGIGRGRGEQIEAVKLARAFHVVIAKPPFGAVTKDVFRALQLDDSRSMPSDTSAEHIEAILAGTALGQNDLAAPLKSACPDFSDWFDRLNTVEPGWMVSGSGTSVFRIVPNRNMANRLVSRIRSGCGQTFACAAGPGRMTVHADCELLAR